MKAAALLLDIQRSLKCLCENDEEAVGEPKDSTRLVAEGEEGHEELPGSGALPSDVTERWLGSIWITIEDPEC